MPTSARLAAAVCYGLLAWIVSGMVIEVVPEKENWGSFQPFNALVGLVVGWFVVGKRVRVDYVTAMGIGFTGMVAAVFWVLFFHSFNTMLELALDRRYDGPVEAIVSIFKIALEYSAYLVHVHIIATLVVGGILSGMIAEFVDRRWS
ncbi:TrgA family protein [Alisedimentitalea sp. MJ-SS2]|uniref:TrgA family protein n=1 Tax=Aliisedimentitalea sp. MJ-SS2 TaxID=3049795 RepID=UPI002906B508|nr:TrgA family protein [Alisedimentitalea sp. MJ-SS2]MDU8929209.1 TrgA family protein [Alisedimentitalea sp. MJ-SS2]